MPLPISGGGQEGNERLSHSCFSPRPPAGDNEVVVSQDSDSESPTPIRTNSYSGNATEEDDEEEDSLDDWEAIADALNSESQAELESPSPDPVAVPERASLPPRVRARPEMIPKPAANPRAWRPDDEFRPQSLPNLAKQRSFPSNLDRRYGHAAGKWTNIGIISTPSACPICYEDLDLTDSSFVPCSCGFRLCLFCHKRILEEADGRCPGCRSPYSPVQEEVAVNIAPSHCRLFRSCSMSIRY